MRSARSGPLLAYPSPNCGIMVDGPTQRRRRPITVRCTALPEGMSGECAGSVCHAGISFAEGTNGPEGSVLRYRLRAGGDAGSGRPSSPKTSAE